MTSQNPLVCVLRLLLAAAFAHSGAFALAQTSPGSLELELDNRQVAVTEARAALLNASIASPRPGPDIRSKVEALQRAERSLADARAGYFALVETNLGSLSAEEAGSLVQKGLHAGETVRGPSMPVLSYFHEPDPIEFENHSGFSPIFDGNTLKDWDGDPTIWSVKDHAIVGVSTKEHPVHNSYIAYHGTQAKDFDLRLELRVTERGGSGIQYRSAVGVPWRRALPPGSPPPNLQWMMTGPQADFWPDKSYYTGQFYSENTPLGIIAWRGEVVRSVPGRNPRLVARIGNLTELGTYVKGNDWNQYEVIARGGTMLHIINGQLMAVEIDDDPASSNNASGLIGIEIENTPCTVSARDIWLRKLQ